MLLATEQMLRWHEKDRKTAQEMLDNKFFQEGASDTEVSEYLRIGAFLVNGHS
jgi:hypothetical protein